MQPLHLDGDLRHVHAHQGAYPFGHVPNPITLPLGAMVEIDVDQQVLRALEPTVGESRN